MESELLAPAGDFETALAAFAAGADAVYCGLADFSARAFAKNFSPEDLKNLIRYAHAGGRRPGDEGQTKEDRPSTSKRVYVTFNTLVDGDSLDGAIAELARLAEMRPDGLIVQDLGIARLCREHFPELELHASTQLVAHNLEGVLALRELGFRRVVLARELSLEEIASIAKRCGETELECFVHGALCYSVSGLCLYGAMEKGRSGNRGTCPYCCRQSFGGHYPFSMKDLRLGADVRRLADAGVASLKIEGRMKSPLYVASVTRYYRQMLGRRSESEVRRGDVTLADLETVFSRRTTELYFNGRAGESPIDDASLGHLGTPIGRVKRVTKDREGRRWVRFHTSRALETHDGLQFDSMSEGKHLGLGIREMRQAISRVPVFEVSAGTDVEIELPEEFPICPGENVYCSMSNAVRRMFPAPSFRPSDCPGEIAVDFSVSVSAECLSVRATADGLSAEAASDGTFDPAKNPGKTFSSVETALGKLGGTDYRLGRVALDDPDRRFVPMSVLNDLRRDLVERLDDARARRTSARIERAQADDCCGTATGAVRRTIRLRPGQRLPAGEWDEVVVAVAPGDADLSAFAQLPNLRLALPVYTAEPEFNRLRSLVKRLLREGHAKWEAGDLATLRMLKAVGVTDITADWTCYAFNAPALRTWSDLGVRRFVASPENDRENLQYLAESGYDVEFLAQQSTPLFLSLTEPAAQDDARRALRESGVVVSRLHGLFVTTKSTPRTFAVPAGASSRIDLSWDPPPEALP